MITFFNVETILTAAKAQLIADATLAGSAYLGAYNKVYGGKAPGDAVTPYLVVTLDMWSVGDQGYGTGELRVTNYTKLLPNGQIDPKGNLILTRCEELLNNAVLDVVGASMQALVGLGTVPHLWDPQDLSKSRGLVRFRCEGGKNG